MPWSINFAPGIGLRHVPSKQGIEHVIHCLKHIWKQTTIGKFMTFNINQAQLYILCNDQHTPSGKPAFHAMDAWPMDIYNISVPSHHKNKNNPQESLENIPIQDGDYHIMDEICDSTNNIKHLQILNRCHLYLQEVSQNDWPHHLMNAIMHTNMMPMPFRSIGLLHWFGQNNSNQDCLIISVLGVPTL